MRPQSPGSMEPAEGVQHNGEAARTFALLADILREASAAFERESSEARAYVARASDLLDAVQRAHGVDGPACCGAGLAPWQLRRVVRHVESSLENSIPIEDLAGLVRLSLGHFSKAFRQSVGVSPHNYVIERRIERAKRLMLTTDQALCEVSIACGLSDQAHLSRLFRRCTGRTPNAWRREQRTDDDNR
jgi:AraC family transcriptional regulator